MKIIIDKECCNKNGISLGELLSLIAVANDVDIGDSMQNLIDKRLITSTNSNKPRLTNNGVKQLNSIIIDSTEYSKIDKDNLESLAKKLQELYPSGRKEGTSFMWKGSTAEIARKLRTLRDKYHFKFTEEQAIKATQSYIQLFNGSYKYMQLLKYFILKTVRDVEGNTEIKSEFMSLIENENQVDQLKDDWTSTIT